MLFWLLVDVFWAGRGSRAISVFLTPVVCTDFVTSRGNASARAVGVVDTVTLVSILLVLKQLQTDLYQSLVFRHQWWVTSLNVLLLSGFVLTDQHYCTNHQPCRNGGTCINDANKNFTCACSVGNTGQRCENVVCYNSICQNGGKCQV